MNTIRIKSADFYPNWTQWNQDSDLFEVCDDSNVLIAYFECEGEAIDFTLKLNKKEGAK